MSQNPDVDKIPYSGLQTIDLQHRQIASLIEKLLGLAEKWSAHSGDSLKYREAFQYALHDLFMFYVEHFQFEENLSVTFQFPDLAEHRNAHTKILAYVAQCTHALAVGKEVDLVEVAQFLATAYKQHEVDDDPCYVCFLLGNVEIRKDRAKASKSLS